MTYECIGKRSERPYLIKDTQTGIYSMEELLYYIRENVFMIEPDDFGNSLVRFIRKALELPDLAGKYEEMLLSNTPFADRICLLYSETGYSQESEIETLRKALNMSEHMSNNDSHRVRGDFFYKSGRLAEAVIEYEAALSLIDEEQNPKDAGRLLSGIGSVSAKMFRFDAAKEYFKHAHRLLPEDPEILNKLIKIVRLTSEDEEFYNYMRGSGIPENIYSKVLEEISAAEKRIKKEGPAKALQEAQKAKSEGDYTSYKRLRKNVLNEWKKRYRSG